jgi:DNA-binding LacI/PurR family transcriptional regulator
MPDRRPTIDDVARRAGVSKGAVSFALNGRPGVAPATRERILAAASELGWRPNHRARALSRSRAFALGLVMARPPELLNADPFFPALIAGVEAELAPAGHVLVLQVVPDDWRREVDGYRQLAEDGRVDGVFLSDLRLGDPRLALLEELALPAVTLGRSDTRSPFPAVLADDRPGIEAAVHHLAGLGHGSIAHVAGPQRYVHGVSRRSAWEQALRSAGLPLGPLQVGDFTAAGGAAATRELLAAPEPPTAIVYANDLMAIAGITVAHQLGVAVPGQLSVTGFDDTELAAHVHPPLTTVRQDPISWGRAAARALLDLVEGREAGDLELPPARLVVRESTASPPATRRRVPRPRADNSEAGT